MDVVKSSILKAVFATSLILSIGLIAGLQMDQARTDFLENQLQETNIQTETFLVSQSYLEDSSRNYCKVMDKKVPELAKKNAQIGRDLQSFSSKSIGSDKDYKYIKKKYYINQLKLYTLLDDYKGRCDSETNLILFFFDDDIDSKRQGAVLTNYREEVDNKTYVFSYNLETKESTILDMLKTDYSIEDGPVTVVNGDNIYREYISLKGLREEIE
jgi:hypothetical protein